jgi:hypothetical protein
MKRLFPFALIAAALLSGGCASVAKQIESFPEGTADSLRYTRTGKFSSTTIEVADWDKNPETVKAAKISVKHSNVWMPNLELTAEGYERKRSPEAKD